MRLKKGSIAKNTVHLGETHEYRRLNRMERKARARAQVMQSASELQIAAFWCCLVAGFVWVFVSPHL